MELLQGKHRTLYNLWEHAGLFQHSTFFLAIIDGIDKLLKKNAAELYMKKKSFQKSTLALGPTYDYSDVEKRSVDFVRIWRESSLNIFGMLKVRGVPYLHVLQPNQYVPNSKVFSQEELDYCLVSDPPIFKEVVRKDYPLLQEAGTSLRDVGVTFLDATRVFQNYSETVYRDHCCHLNAKGNEILADFVADYLEQSMIQ